MGKTVRSRWMRPTIGGVDQVDSALNAGSFTQSISIRDRTDAQVTLNGTVKAASYNLSVDQGSITVNGTIDRVQCRNTQCIGKSDRYWRFDRSRSRR